MCEYNTDPEAIKLSRFLADNAPHMGIDQLTNALYDRLHTIDPEGPGHDHADIKAHIQNHVLIPSVKISSVLRSLILLLDKLEAGLVNTSDEDVTIIDAKNVGIYLKTVNEIMQIYKTGECGKMMFGDMTHQHK